MYFITAALLFASLLGLSSQEENLSNFVPRCRATNSIFYQCLKHIIEDLKPKLINGDAKLGISPLDPLHVRNLSVDRARSLVATYHVILKKNEYTGTKNFEILEDDVDLDALKLKLKLRFPHINWVLQGNATGKIFGFNVNGDGRGDVIIDNLILDVYLNGEKFDKEGNTYVKWKKNNVDVKYDSIKFTVKDLFPSEVQLRAFSDAINYNTELIASHIDPVLEYSLGSYFVDTINHIHSKYAINNLYAEKR